MLPSACSYSGAMALLKKDDPLGAMRLCGPMLMDNPGNLDAWYVAALATHRIGDEKSAGKNLRSVALAMAQGHRPIRAVAVIVELLNLGLDPLDVLSKIALMYGAGGNLEEKSPKPPPLPPGSAAVAWEETLEAAEIKARCGDAMAMAWGAALTGDSDAGPLPYVPLLSAMAPAEFESFVRVLRLQRAKDGDIIMEQGEPGDSLVLIAEGTVLVTIDGEVDQRVELARLGPGAFLGEMALVSSAPRAARAIAEGPVTLLKVGVEQVGAIADSEPRVADVLVGFCHARMIENVIRLSPVLSLVPPSRRADLVARFDTAHAEAGHVIIEQGEEGNGLYVLVSGAVQVSRTTGETQQTVASLGPGDLFGEISLVMRKPATARVTALQNSALLVLSRQRFSAVTRDYPELLKGAFDIAVEREDSNNSILGQIVEQDEGYVLI